MAQRRENSVECVLMENWEDCANFAAGRLRVLFIWVAGLPRGLVNF